MRLLRYLAAEEVVHLDIKPSNIIMAGRPRLIDLSVARRMRDIGALSAPVGTDPYMAPEQCEPARFGELAPATDEWGLGATLFEALAGVPPFAPDGDRFPQLRAAPAPLPRHVLAALVAGCLAPRPADRPSLTQLDEQLQTVVERLPAPRLSRFRPGGAARLRGLEPA